MINLSNVNGYFSMAQEWLVAPAPPWGRQNTGPRGWVAQANTKHLVFNKEDAAEGQWIESGAHLMLFPKDPASLDGQTTDFNSGAPYVMFKGTGYDHLMIPVEGYYDYQDPK